MVTPSSVNKTVEQGEAVFCCQHRSSDAIIIWRVNGTSISSHNISTLVVPVGDGGFASFLSIATHPGFNNTVIECGAVFLDGSPLLFTYTTSDSTNSRHVKQATLLESYSMIFCLS